MRRPILALSLCLAVAGQARAQMQMMTPMNSPMNTATYGGGSNFPATPTPQQRYNQRILALRDRMQKLTRADGGQLSAEHKAALQKDLDALNRQFGIKPAG